MKGLTETDIKYLAGLIDSDGWISLNFQKSVSTNRIYLQLSIGLSCSNKIDIGGQYIRWLSDIVGVYNKHTDGTDTIIHTCRISKRSELNQLIPRLLKHMIIKARHLDRLYTAYSIHRGISLDGDTIGLLKEMSKHSRLDSGPLKPKNYPTKAWTAGYLDGDGHYGFHKRNRDNYIRLSIDVLSTKEDSIGLELLFKTYGGNISHTQKHPRWYRGLGKQHRTFAISFLKTMHRHSRLKKHKIEKMLSFHNYSRND